MQEATVESRRACQCPGQHAAAACRLGAPAAACRRCCRRSSGCASGGSPGSAEQIDVRSKSLHNRVHHWMLPSSLRWRGSGARLPHVARQAGCGGRAAPKLQWKQRAHAAAVLAHNVWCMCTVTHEANAREAAQHLPQLRPGIRCGATGAPPPQQCRCRHATSSSKWTWRRSLPALQTNIHPRLHLPPLDSTCPMRRRHPRRNMDLGLTHATAAQFTF